jgi:hypothetical protein
MRKWHQCYLWMLNRYEIVHATPSKMMMRRRTLFNIIWKKVKDSNSSVHRFRKWIEVQGIKKQKIAEMDWPETVENEKGKQNYVLEKTNVASDYWIYEFQKCHNIVSRKITSLKEIFKTKIYDQQVYRKFCK